MRAAATYNGSDPVNIGTGTEIQIRDLTNVIARLTRFEFVPDGDEAAVATARELWRTIAQGRVWSGRDALEIEWGSEPASAVDTAEPGERVGPMPLLPMAALLRERSRENGTRMKVTVPSNGPWISTSANVGMQTRSIPEGAT